MTPLRFTSIEYDPPLDQIDPPPPSTRVKKSIGRMGAGCHLHPKGYIRISAGPFRGKLLHQLIWQWTHPEEILNSSYDDIHHKDGDPTNFHPDNLEKVPHHGHARHTIKAGRLKHERGRFASTRRARSEEVPF